MYKSSVFNKLTCTEIISGNMWFLTNSAGTRTYIQSNKELSFGRKKCDILLENDDSVSRSHASITVTQTGSTENTQPGSKCILKDLGSKYGTYICNDAGEYTKVSTHVLKKTEKIRFGLQNHIFTVHHVPIITATSTISEDDKETLGSIFNHIDGIISEEWLSSCTHLTVTEAILTEKVVWALICAIPIVTVVYWEQVKKAIEKGLEVPSANDFVTPIKEGLINKAKVSLTPNTARNHLFKDLIFIFSSTKQYKVYGKMVHMAGGKSVLYGKKPFTLKEFCASNVVAVQFPSDEASQATQLHQTDYEQIYKEMQKKNLRMVPESEIPLAIVNCATNKYCNPRHTFKLRQVNRPSDWGKVIVSETQGIEKDVRILPTIISDVRVKADINTRKSKISNIIVPETCDILTGCDSTNESTTMSKNMEESQNVTKKHSGHNANAEGESVKCSTRVRLKVKDVHVINGSVVKEKVTSPNKEKVKNKREAVIIPETLEDLDESNKSNCIPVIASPEVSIMLTPKKQHVSKEQAENLPNSPKTSQPLKPCNEVLANRFKKNPVCVQAETKVANWLANSEVVRKALSESPKTSPVKFPSSENENRQTDISERTSQGHSKKRNGSSSDTEERRTKRNPNEKPLQNEIFQFVQTTPMSNCSLSSINTVTDNSPNRVPRLRSKCFHKTFKKAKLAIPKQRVSTSSMITIVNRIK